jgi:sulfonate transport system ATP-binding protein
MLGTLHRQSVLLVTHRVEEALLLADRALVSCDGRIAESFDITVAHPRSMVDPAFSALRRRLLLALGVNPEAPTGADA